MRLSHKIVLPWEERFDGIADWLYFFKKAERIDIYFFGGDSKEATPVPIPNTEVKLFSADGTAWEAVWESRTLPEIFFIARCLLSGTGFFSCCCLRIRKKAGIRETATHFHVLRYQRGNTRSHPEHARLYLLVSSLAPMVLHGKLSVRVGRCRKSFL